MDTEDRAEEEEDISLLASYTSLAPILDCCIVESDGGGGASSVITCSGAYKGGSLRVIRQGVGLDELAALEMEGVQKIFHIKAKRVFIALRSLLVTHRSLILQRARFTRT